VNVHVCLSSSRRLALAMGIISVQSSYQKGARKRGVVGTVARDGKDGGTEEGGARVLWDGLVMEKGRGMI